MGPMDPGDGLSPVTTWHISYERGRQDMLLELAQMDPAERARRLSLARHPSTKNQPPPSAPSDYLPPLGQLAPMAPPGSVVLVWLPGGRLRVISTCVSCGSETTVDTIPEDWRGGEDQ